MGLYSAGITGEDPTDNVGGSAPVTVNVTKTGDTFWTAVKWLGAALVLVNAWREGQAFYRRKLAEKEGQGEAET